MHHVGIIVPLKPNYSSSQLNSEIKGALSQVNCVTIKLWRVVSQSNVDGEQNQNEIFITDEVHGHNIYVQRTA